MFNIIVLLYLQLLVLFFIPFSCLGFVWGFIASKSLSTAFNFFQISGVIPFISWHI